MLEENRPDHSDPPPPLVDGDNRAVRERRKDDLFVFESTPAPRPDDVSARYAGKVAPWWGFVAYGALWFFLSFVMFAIGMLPGVMIGIAIGADGTWWMQIVCVGGGAAAFILAWVWFARWVRRRRGSTQPLIRNGVIVQGRVFDPWSGPKLDVVVRSVLDLAKARLGYRIYRVEVALDGKRLLLHVPKPIFGSPPIGTPVKALVHAGALHALIFDDKGKAKVVGVGR